MDGLWMVYGWFYTTMFNHVPPCFPKNPPSKRSPKGSFSTSPEGPVISELPVSTTAGQTPSGRSSQIWVV
jgi:hypothetical protein